MTATIPSPIPQSEQSQDNEVAIVEIRLRPRQQQTIEALVQLHPALYVQIHNFVQGNRMDFDTFMTQAAEAYLERSPQSWTEQLEYNETDGGAA